MMTSRCRFQQEYPTTRFVQFYRRRGVSRYRKDLRPRVALPCKYNESPARLPSFGYSPDTRTRAIYPSVLLGLHY